MTNLNNYNDETFKYLKELKKHGILFQNIDDHEIDGRYYVVNNKQLINFSSCSYLGLETRQELKEGSVTATQKYGTQTPLARGGLSAALYPKVEKLVETIFSGFPVLTQTVTLGHFSVLPLLVENDDAIILDAYVHNSVRMASQNCVANGTLTLVSKHNDIEHVEYLVGRLKKQGKKRIWYCCDGVYSMLGNFCDIKGINKLLKKDSSFHVYIDDAHGSGWYGKNGRGFVLENCELHERMIVAVSFAKSFATCGGALIIPNKQLAEYIRMRGQTLIFSGALPPPILGALYASLKLHSTSEIEILQNKVTDLVSYFREKCTELGLKLVTKNLTPIQLVQVGSVEKTLKVLQFIIDKGFYCLPAVFPAVRKGEEGLRITLTPHLSKEDIDLLLLSLKETMNI